MQIIGLSGFARSGKDETAKVLVEQFGFKQVAFADKLREFLYALNPLVEYEGVEDRHAMKRHYLQEVIDEYGWQGYKETGFSNSIRTLLQRLGTEAGRQTLWDTIWIDAAFAGLPQDAKIVVSDARFFNEFDAIRARGGEVWRINRPGVGPANDHASEMEAINYEFDRILNNSRDLDFLRGIVSGAHADFQSRVAARNAVPKIHDPVDDQGLRSGPISEVPNDGVVRASDMPKRRG